MIRCIASDMDGTLLNSNQEISKLNREALLFAKEQGIEVVIATGRSYDEAHYVLQEAGIHCPIIAVNGAEIRNERGEIVHSTSLDGKVALSVAKVLNQLGIYFEVYTDKGKYTENYEKSISIIVDIYKTANPAVPVNEIRSSVEDRFAKGFIKTIDDYERLFSNDDYKLYKILVFSQDKNALDHAYEKLSAIREINVTSSGHDNLEINHVSAQKGIALEAFVKERNIDLRDTLAVGDNFNDLSMLKKVGFPFAMGNAEEEIKKIISNHTTSNDEDGVGKAIFGVLKKVAN